MGFFSRVGLVVLKKVSKILSPFTYFGGTKDLLFASYSLHFENYYPIKKLFQLAHHTCLSICVFVQGDLDLHGVTGLEAFL